MDRRWPAPQPRGALREFLRFGAVGTLGFLVDAGVLLAALGLGFGPYPGRVLSYLAAATTTFALNRAWTFRARGGQARPGRQWALFVLVNLSGFAVNFGTYAALLAWAPLVARHPVIGVAAGALPGMASNFLLSRHVVFPARRRTGSEPPATERRP